jgi:hypothetical protein
VALFETAIPDKAAYVALHILKQTRGFAVITQMPPKTERVELKMKIMKYRELARNAPDEVTRQRVSALVSELEQELREIDE